MDNYYKILNVREDAPQEVIRAAYKALSMVYHPDRNESEDANELMQKINVAYSVLSVPEKRKDYDRILLENSFNKDWIDENQFDKHREEGTGLTEEELKSEIVKNIIEQLQKKQQTLKEHYKRFEEVTQQKEQETFDEESWQQQKAQWDKEHEDFRRIHQEEFRRSRCSNQQEASLDKTESLCAENADSKVNVDFSIAVNKNLGAALLPEDKFIQPSDLHDPKLGSSGPLRIKKTETKAEVPLVVDDRQEPTLSRDLQNESIPSSQLHRCNDAFSQKEEKKEQHPIGFNKNNGAEHKTENPENEDRYSGLSFNELRWVIIVAYLIFSYFLIMGNEWYTYWTSEPHKQEGQTTKLDEVNPTNKATEELPAPTEPFSERKSESYREKLIRNQVF